MNKPYIHGMLPDVTEASPAPAAKAEQPAMRFLGDMQRLQPQPGDVFVLTCEQRIDEAVAERIKAKLSSQLGGATVLVLGGGLKLGVVADPRIAADLAACPSRSSMAVVDQGQFTRTFKVAHTTTVGDVALPEAVRTAIRKGVMASGGPVGNKSVL